MRQALSAARLVTDDENSQHRYLQEASRILSEIDVKMTPPHVGEKIYGMVSELSGNPDPFREQKKEQNRVAQQLLPWMRETLALAGDPLEMAVRLSIAGNVVDPGAQESFDLERSVMKAVDSEGSLESYPALREKVKGAGSILFIADNCGEVVFDRVLIETMLEMSDASITVAVRDKPIINDVTRTEAAEVGLDDFCRVISSGMEMPGTYLPRCSDEFLKIFESADLVIAKGQGNWETLEDCDRELFFLLQAKCRAVAEVYDCEVGQPLLIHKPAGSALQRRRGRAD